MTEQPHGFAVPKSGRASSVTIEVPEGGLPEAEHRVSGPTVSVVMSTFNAEQFLSQAIDSILTQSYVDFEFIIINDGSTDGSASILERYQNNDSRVRVFHQENSGLVASLNRGCSLARGRLIARMDADDIALTDRLMQQVNFMRMHPEVAVLGGAVEWIDATGNPLGTYDRPCDHRAIELSSEDGCPIWHPTAVFRKEAFVSVGGYRPVVLDAEDYDLWLRIADRFKLANLPDVVLRYRVHPAQISVRKGEGAALGALAARASASARRSGNPDPLESVPTITPDVFERLGIDEKTRRAALARQSLTSIRNMYKVGKCAAAYEALQTMLLHNASYAESWVRNDLRLLQARFLWNHGKFARSAFLLLRTVAARPVILGRPVKWLGRYVMRGWQAKRETGPTELSASRPKC